MLALKAIEVLCLVQVLFVIPSSSQGNSNSKSQTQKFCFFASSELIYENVMKQVAASAKCEGGGRLVDNKVSLGGVQGIVEDYDSIWGAVYFVDEADYQHLLRYAQSRSQLSFMSQARIALPKTQLLAVCRTIDIGVISSGFPLSSRNEVTFESTVDQYVERMRQLGAPEKYLRKLTTAQKWIPPSFVNNNLTGQSPKQNQMRRRITTKIMNQKTSKRFTPYPLSPYPPTDDTDTLEREQPLRPTISNTPTRNQIKKETVKKENENFEHGVTQIVTENQSPGMPPKQQITTVSSNNGSRPLDSPVLPTDEIPIQRLQDQNPVSLEDGSPTNPLLSISSPSQPIPTEILDDKSPNSRYSRPLPIQNSPAELDRQNLMKQVVNEPNILQLLKPNESPREILEELHYPGNPKSPGEINSQNPLQSENSMSKISPINSSPLLQTPIEMLEEAIMNPGEARPTPLANDQSHRLGDRVPKIPQLSRNNLMDSYGQNPCETQDNTIPNEEIFQQPLRRQKKPKRLSKSFQNSPETLENSEPMNNDLPARFSPKYIQASYKEPSHKTLEAACDDGPSFKSLPLENMLPKQTYQNQPQTLDMLSDESGEDSSEEIDNQPAISTLREPQQEFPPSVSMPQNTEELAKENLKNPPNILNCEKIQASSPQKLKETLQNVQSSQVLKPLLQQNSPTELPQQNVNQPEDMLLDNSSEEVSDQLLKPQVLMRSPLQTTPELVRNKLENPIPLKDHPEEFFNEESTVPHVNPQTPKEILEREISPLQEKPAEQFAQNPITPKAQTSSTKKPSLRPMQRRNTPREVIEHEIRNRRKPLPMQNQQTELQDGPQHISPNYESGQSIISTANSDKSIDNILPSDIQEKLQLEKVCNPQLTEPTTIEDRLPNISNQNPRKLDSTPLQNNPLEKECGPQIAEPTIIDECLPNVEKEYSPQLSVPTTIMEDRLPKISNRNPRKPNITSLQNNPLEEECDPQLVEPIIIEERPSNMEKECSPQLDVPITMMEERLPKISNRNPHKPNSTSLQNNPLEEDCGPQLTESITTKDNPTYVSSQDPCKPEDEMPNENVYGEPMIPPKKIMQQLSFAKPGLSNNSELLNGPIVSQNSPHEIVNLDDQIHTPLKKIPKQVLREMVANPADSEPLATQRSLIKNGKISEEPENMLPNVQILDQAIISPSQDKLKSISPKQPLLQNVEEMLEEKIENPQPKNSKLSDTPCRDNLLLPDDVLQPLNAPKETLKTRNIRVSEPLSQERDTSEIIQQKLQEKTEKAAQDLHRTIKEVLASSPDIPEQPGATTIISSNADNPTILANDKPIMAPNSSFQDNPKPSTISDTISTLDKKAENLQGELLEEEGELFDENTLPLLSSSKVRGPQNSELRSYSTSQSKQVESKQLSKIETKSIKINQPQDINSLQPSQVAECSEAQTQSCKNSNQEVQETVCNTSVLSSPDPQCKETRKNLRANDKTLAQSNAQANESINNPDNSKMPIPGYTLGRLVPEFDVLTKAIEPTFLRGGATFSQTQIKNAVSAASSELQQKQTKYTANIKSQQTQAKSIATAENPNLPDSPVPLISMPVSTSDGSLAQVTVVNPSTDKTNTKITATPISTPNTKGINIQTVHPNGISSATQVTSGDGSNKVSTVSVSSSNGPNRSGTKVMEIQSGGTPGSAMASSSAISVAN